MNDARRVSDLSVAELLEAAISAMAELGVTVGTWAMSVQVENGHVRRLRMGPTPPDAWATLDRRQLDGRPGDEKRAA